MLWERDEMGGRDDLLIASYINQLIFITVKKRKKERKKTTPFAERNLKEALYM